MDEEERSTKRRGLFRRNRDEFEQDRPLAELDTVDEDESITVPSLSKRPRSTADMFATPKEKFADNWSDDAWDDEWKEPAFRRPSIPSAASPEPEQVDAWLENDASAWDDVTRDSVRRMGGDPGIATQKTVRGSTWDSTSDLGPVDTAVVVAKQKLEQSQTELVSASDVSGSNSNSVVVTDSGKASSPVTLSSTVEKRGGELEDAIERALASVQTPDESLATKFSTDPSQKAKAAQVERVTSPRFGREKSTATISEPIPAVAERIPTVTEHTPNSQAPEIQQSLAGTPGDVIVDLVQPGSVQAGSVQPGSVQPGSVQPGSVRVAATTPLVTPAIVTPDPALTDPTSPGIPALGTAEAKKSPADSKPAEAKLDETKAKLTDPKMTDPKMTGSKLSGSPANTVARSAREVANTQPVLGELAPGELVPSELVPSEEDFIMDRNRAAAFVDRASWIGAGVAFVTAVRLMLHLASSMKLGNPTDSPLSAGNRIGQAFANIGPLHGLLMIAAIALLALPSVMANSVDVPRRTGTGLGIMIGCALLGLIGGVVGLAVQSTLATREGTVVSLADRAELVALVGLSLVALGGALRALSSYESDGDID
jgi:hypothetical protein